MKSLSLSSPHIIAMVGMPGVGKTHFAEQFAETFSAPLVSAQSLEKLNDDPNLVKETALNILSEVTKTKQTVLFDGPTDRRVERMELSKMARQKGYKVLFVWVQTNESTAKQRALKQISPESYEYHAKRFSAPHESENYIVLSGRHTYSTQARVLLKRLTEPRAKASSVAPGSVVPERKTVTSNRIHIG